MAQERRHAGIKLQLMYSIFIFALTRLRHVCVCVCVWGKISLQECFVSTNCKITLQDKL